MFDCASRLIGHGTIQGDLGDITCLIYSREGPVVDQARDIAQVSLDRAVAYETARTVEHLAHQGLPIYPQTLETYNAFVKYLKEEQ